jgi:hypothetical protein
MAGRNNGIMGLEAEETILMYQEFFQTHYSTIPFFQQACRMAGSLRSEANLYIFLWFCQ